MKLDTLIKKRLSELEEQSHILSEQSFIPEDVWDSVAHIPLSSFKGWATNVLNLFQRAFSEESVHYQQFLKHTDSFQGKNSEFEICLAIFLAAKEDYEGGYLFNLRGLVKAEVFDDAFEQGFALLNAGYKDPAAVLAGVALESTLKELCTRYCISIGKLDKMNADLCKAGIYNMAKQKQITAWAELRNKAAHGGWAEYNESDVKYFLEGVQRFVEETL